MSFPPPGIYKIQNVETGTYLRLESANTAHGTPIVGYQDDGSAANLWQAVIDTENGLVTFQTALADAFIQTKDGDVSAGTYLVIEPTAVEFQLVSIGNDQFRIHLTDVGTDMVFNLASNADNTTVTIEVNNDASTNQLWTFIQD